MSQNGGPFKSVPFLFLLKSLVQNPMPCVKFHSISSHFKGSLYLFYIRTNKKRNFHATGLQLLDGLANIFFIFHHVQAPFGGELLTFFGHKTTPFRLILIG